MRDGPVLLTGAAGLLGHWLLRSAPAERDVVALRHRRAVPGVPGVHADLRQRAAVVAAVSEVAPALVVHAAYAKDEASIVDATRHLVDAAHVLGAPVLAISSDAVFRGDGIPRDELALPDAGWDYGRWKAAAEQLVLDGSGPGAVVRLPLLVSIDPDDDAVHKIRSAAAEGGRTQWYTDELRRPAWASEVAAAVWRIAALPVHERLGCWHLAGAEALSRHELAGRVVDHLGLASTSIETATRPPGSDRPRDLAFTDARARAAIAWRPSTVLG